MKNLIKHEFRATARLMVPLYIVAFVSGIIAFLFTDSSILPEKFLTFAMIIFIGSLVLIGVMCFIIIISRFYHNVMTDNAYLTMTLPITTHEFIFGELIISLIWIVLSIILIMAIALVFFIAKDVLVLPSLSDINIFFNIVSDGLSKNGISVWEIIAYCVEALIIFILCIFAYCLRFYFIMAVGQMFTNKKILMCVLIYVVMQFLLPASLFTFASLVSNIFSKITPAFGLSVILAALTVCVVFYLPTAYILKNKLNIQ